MLNRRSLLLATASLISATVLRIRPLRAQEAAVSAAVEFVRKTGAELIAIINAPGPLAGKQTQLQQIIDRSVDVEGIADFCLGRFLRQATPQQKTEYVQLFHAVLLKSVSGKLGEYAGVKLTVGRGNAHDDGVVVASVIERPNNQPNNVDWLIETQGGAMKITDVVAEGTSLRLTTRTDYNSFLSRNGGSVQTLIDALRKQAAGA